MFDLDGLAGDLVCELVALSARLQEATGRHTLSRAEEACLLTPSTLAL
jgi:hypothetical protein